MKIFLTGASGFVGRDLLQRLVDQGYLVRCLVRRETAATLPQLAGVEVHIGDATDPESLNTSMRGCDAVINLIGIIREFPRQGITFERMHVATTGHLLEAARTEGVSRFLQMSANGTRADAVTDYHKTKWEAEEAVRHSGLDWTIFRPSLIYGPGDEFVNMLANMLRKLPIIPVMGHGRYRMQPVQVGSVTTSFVAALSREDSIGQTFLCGGPKPLSYNELLDQIGAALGKPKVCKLHHPLLLMRPVISVMEGFAAFPITLGQLQMLLEENICDPGPWEEFFGIEQDSFADGIARYLGAKPATTT